VSKEEIAAPFLKSCGCGNKATGSDHDYILDATYLECEQAYNQAIKK
jgi:hypothetical protein